MKKLNTDLPYIIGDYSINQLISELDNIEDKEITLPWSSLGGSVWAGQNMEDYLTQTDKQITARVTGIAASMGAALLPFFHKVIGAKQADVMIHSVATEISAIRKRKNEDLYNALSAKIDEPKFKDVTGFELKDVMFLEGEDRKDVWLSGQQAFDMGLFDELIDLTPEETTANAALINEFKLSAELGYKLPERLTNDLEKDKISTNNNNLNNSNMNVDELKAKHPEVYNEVLDSGNTEGKAELQAQNDSWMVFNDVAPDKVKAGIESGKPMTKAEELTFLRMSQKSTLQADLEAESKGTGEVVPKAENAKVLTEEQKADAKVEAELKAHLNIEE